MAIPRSAWRRCSARASPSADSLIEQRAPRRCARCRRARVREVIVDLPAHAIDLLRDGGGHLELAGSPRALRLVRKDGERRLQPVRQVAGLRDRAPHRLLPLVEQRVEIVDERLHLRRVVAVDAPVAALVQSGKTRSKVVDRRHAAPHLQQARRSSQNTANSMTSGCLKTSCTAKANGTLDDGTRWR